MVNKLDWSKFSDKFHPSWHSQMKEIIESPEVYEIYQKLKEDGQKYKITPDSQNVFKAFEIDMNKINVVLMGMSPYPQVILNMKKASGLCFDCSQYGKISPSLEKLYDAMEDDCYNGLALERDKKEKSLQYLVNQGVMLCNAGLTCIKDRPDSHIELWKPFWKQVFEKILFVKPSIFILMGKAAQELEQYTDPFIHKIYKCEHPVAASYASRRMEHNHVFSKAAKDLKAINNIDLEWLDSEVPF